MKDMKFLFVTEFEIKVIYHHFQSLLLYYLFLIKDLFNRFYYFQIIIFDFDFIEFNFFSASASDIFELLI